MPSLLQMKETDSRLSILVQQLINLNPVLPEFKTFTLPFYHIKLPPWGVRILRQQAILRQTGIWIKTISIILLCRPCSFQSSLFHDTHRGQGQRTQRLKPWLRAGASGELGFLMESWSSVLEERQPTLEKEIGCMRHEIPHNTVGLELTVMENSFMQRWDVDPWPHLSHQPLLPFILIFFSPGNHPQNGMGER